MDARVCLESGDFDDCYRALAQLGEALHHIREMEAVSLSKDVYKRQAQRGAQRGSRTPSGSEFALQRVKHGRERRFFARPEGKIARALANQHAQPDVYKRQA